MIFIWNLPINALKDNGNEIEIFSQSIKEMKPQGIQNYLYNLFAF